MIKCGFEFEGTLRERSSFGDAQMHSIIKRDYEALKMKTSI